MLDVAKNVPGLLGDSNGYTTAYMAASATTFTVWDMLTHFDNEVEFMWQGSNGWVKWMYLFIRHVPYLAQGSIMTLYATAGRIQWGTWQCRAWIAHQAAVNEVLTVAVEIILVVRIYAMFNRNWTITTIVLICFVGEIVAMCTVLATTIPKFEFTAQCLVTKTPKLFSFYWVISLAFETILFMLTLFKFFSVLFNGQMYKRSIILTLMKDGTWAYAIIFVIMLLNTLMYDVEKNTLSGIFYFWELSVMSFAGSHVILNLRRFAMDIHCDSSFTYFDTLSPRPPFSEMRFASDMVDAPTIELETYQE